MLHPQSRVYYVDPWTGSIFGEGGINALNPLKDSGAAGAHVAPAGVDMETLKGGVIMPKLGNETAK